MNEQLAIGLLAVAVGVSGWLLPYRWNLLRLRRGFARLFSPATNERVPKVVGTLLVAAGLFVIAGSFLGLADDGDAAAGTPTSSTAAAVAGPETAPLAGPAGAATPDAPASLPEADAAPAPRTDADARLLAACAGGATAEVRAALADGAHPDARDDDGWTALLIAIDYESTAAVEALLAAGADPDLPVTGPYGGTPLFYAALGGNLDAVRRLVEAGADLETRSDIDWLTPLLVALSNGHREIARYLVDRGADVDVVDRNGRGAGAYLGEGTTLEDFLDGD